MVLLHDAVSTVAWEWLEGLDDLTHVSGSWCGPQIGTSAGLSTSGLFSMYLPPCVFLSCFPYSMVAGFQKAVYLEYKPQVPELIISPCSSHLLMPYWPKLDT